MTKELTDKILNYLDEHEEVNSLDLAEILKENHQKIVGAIKSLETVGDVSLKKVVFYNFTDLMLMDCRILLNDIIASFNIMFIMNMRLYESICV